MAITVLILLAIVPQALLAKEPAEPVAATIRLSSPDVKLPPAQYPCNRVFDAGDGTVAGECSAPRSDFIPVDIPIEGGSRVTVYCTTTQSVTGNADIAVYIAYE